MNEPAPEPKPKRSRRMIVWMIAVPVAILLLALAGANWKTFHLAYAKHLIASTDPYEQARGIDMVMAIHIRKGMHLEEVRAILAPARVTEVGPLSHLSPPLRGFGASVEGSDFTPFLGFDENDRLRWIQFIPDVSLLGK